MALLVDLTLRHALWPVLFWTGALGLVCLAAVFITLRVVKVMARTRQMSPVIKPFWYAWVIIALFIVPAGSTLLFAAPFAFERELATLVRTQPPVVIDWATNYGSHSLRSAIGVRDDDVLMDVKWVQQQLSSVDHTSKGTLSMVWRAVPDVLQLPYIRAAHGVLSEIGAGSPTITWRQLDRQVRELLKASASVAAQAVSLSLYAGALRYLLFWLVTLVACHLVTLAVYSVIADVRTPLQFQA